MEEYLNTEWQKELKDEFSKEYFSELSLFLKEEYSKKNIFPEKGKLFAALNKINIKEVKVVILGQDPYHTKGLATGLAFSVPDGSKLPPSLKNIHKEILSDTGVESLTQKGSLDSWSEQGVLLLNTILSVEESLPASHHSKGWEEFTSAVLKKISQENKSLIFILWGKFAEKKVKSLDLKNHIVFKSAHPSPLSAYRGFHGSRVFSKCNEQLKKQNKKPIRW